MARPTANERARRLIALLGRLQADTRIPLTELAEQLGASPAEIAADLETLSLCGVAPYDPLVLVPVMVEGDEVVVFGEIPALRGPVRLSASEAGALATALQAAGFPADDPLTSRLIAASAASFDVEELEHVVRSAVATHDREAYETLARAIEQNEVVSLEYVRAGSEEANCRQVEPGALFSERGAWYLTAWCRSANGWRTFRVDRIRSIGPTGEKFEASRASALGGACAFDPSDLPSARLRFSPLEPFVERDWPGARVLESDADGTVVAEVPFAGTEWLSRRVLARLGEVEVIGPDKVRAAVAELGRQELERLS